MNTQHVLIYIYIYILIYVYYNDVINIYIYYNDVINVVNKTKTKVSRTKDYNMLLI